MNSVYRVDELLCGGITNVTEDMCQIVPKCPKELLLGVLSIQSFFDPNFQGFIATNVLCQNVSLQDTFSFPPPPLILHAATRMVYSVKNAFNCRWSFVVLESLVTYPTELDIFALFPNCKLSEIFKIKR